MSKYKKNKGLLEIPSGNTYHGNCRESLHCFSFNCHVSDVITKHHAFGKRTSHYKFELLTKRKRKKLESHIPLESTYHGNCREQLHILSAHSAEQFSVI